ncbi:polynucleotide adenylyltransferase PcnB [Acidithiobacillus sp.]
MVSLKAFIAEQLTPKTIEAVGLVEPAGPVVSGAPLSARVIPRAEHEISRRQLSYGALQVLNGLHRAGFQAYLVGGSVRDLLLGREPKDFDVATDARPEQVRKLFRRNARLIGRRFILAHVQFGEEIIEVATFRGGSAEQQDAGERSASGRILADNSYGTLEEDALRRDLTANALYYNIADRSILDFSTGLEDLRAGRLRMIGDARTRYSEDPVRMLRAVRFAAKLGFRLDEAAQEPIAECRSLLAEVPPARLFDETLKLFLTGHGLASFELLRQHGLFAVLFPTIEAALAEDALEPSRRLLQLALEGTDERVAAGKSVTPAFLFAALLWPALQIQCATMESTGKPPALALQRAAAELLQEASGRVTVPRRFSLPMREIWDLQARFQRRGGRRPYALLAHPRFRAAFDFLELRSRAGEISAALPQWWLAFQEADHAAREALVAQAREEDRGQEQELGPLPASRRRPRRRDRHRGPRNEGAKDQGDTPPSPMDGETG